MVAKTPRNTGRTPAERRAYWFDHLTPEERVQLVEAEAAISAHDRAMKAYLAAMRDIRRELSRERMKLIHKGTGRALYAINGRAEWQAKAKARSKT